MKRINFQSKIKHLSIVLIALFLTACGSTPQPTVELKTNMFVDDKVKVGFVYNAPKDKATTHISGAGCLLCYGVASALTSKLDTHLESTIGTEELTKIKELVISKYKTRSENIELVYLPKAISKLKSFKGELGFAKKDFRALKDSLNVDLLVVLQLNSHGAHRSFSNYIPNGDPQGHIAGLLYSVDLNTNAYVQYLEINENVQPAGEWDEPTSFPSVTTSYYQAIENAKQKIKDAI